MEERLYYRVCPHRNVPAAYERFIGPDSAGMERFYPNANAQARDAVIVAGLCVAQLGRSHLARLAQAWLRRVTHPQLPLLPDPRRVLVLRLRWLCQGTLRVAMRARRRLAGLPRASRARRIDPQLALQLA